MLEESAGDFSLKDSPVISLRGSNLRAACPAAVNAIFLVLALALAAQPQGALKPSYILDASGHSSPGKCSWPIARSDLNSPRGYREGYLRDEGQY